MKRSGWVLLLVCLCQTAGAAQAVETLTPEGLDPIRIGMTRSQAEKALGKKLHLQGEDPSTLASCATASRPDNKAWYMFENYRVVRIDVDKAGIVTPEGVGVGSTKADIRKAYGKTAHFGPHPYGNGTGRSDDWQYVTVHFPALKRDLLFETDEKRVTSFRVGLPRAVSLTEGCS